MAMSRRQPSSRESPFTSTSSAAARKRASSLSGAKSASRAQRWRTGDPAFTARSSQSMAASFSPSAACDRAISVIRRQDCGATSACAFS